METYLQKKHVFVISTDQPNLFPLLHSITSLPTLERYDYFTLVDSIEGYDIKKIDRFFEKK